MKLHIFVDWTCLFSPPTHSPFNGLNVQSIKFDHLIFKQIDSIEWDCPHTHQYDENTPDEMHSSNDLLNINRNDKCYFHLCVDCFDVLSMFLPLPVISTSVASSQESQAEFLLLIAVCASIPKKTTDHRINNTQKSDRISAAFLWSFNLLNNEIQFNFRNT